ncbi:MAG: HpcH/HpaI aldolase/citrate lyase family protein [Gammaproteobacteria bacterium]|nr:HpcH/HpaI aldolase/citrate lyase family protein [Pseudomonadota bacterium]MCH9662072.1 HpcH/HpaI aldolase/citrate lyase family protein [Gammaproteobacteria bacterium]
MSTQRDIAFAQRLAGSDRALYGLWLGMASANATELCSGCGFDWLLIDAEHGPNTLTTVLDQLRAARAGASESSVLVRLPEGNTTLIKQYLDIGAHNLLVPMVDSAAQAQALSEAMRYPPAGVRGLGTSMARAARWNQDGGYLQTANDRVSLIAQIETRAGLDNAAAIAATEGVDAVFIGPSDLSAALGFPGEVGRAEVTEAVEHIIRVCIKAGKPAGALALAPAQAERYISAGARFVGVGVDTVLLSSSAQALARRYIDGATPDAPDKY